MMRAELLETHPDWYAVNREGVSTAEKPPTWTTTSMISR